MSSASLSEHCAQRSVDIADLRRYWDEHVLDWPVATAAVGSPEYFRQIERYRFTKLDYLPRVVDFAAFRDARLLDVGCGLATDTARFALGGARVHGIDISEVAIRHAIENFRQRNLPGTFEVMDGERMSFAPSSFDCVYCHTVLHFTPNPEAMVREIHRVLKPGGVAIIMTVNKHSWMNGLRKVMKVEIDHEDAPVFAHKSIREFEALLGPFREVELHRERFPVPTEVHAGLKGRLYNLIFVGSFNVLPRPWVRGLGHHLIAFCTK